LFAVRFGQVRSETERRRRVQGLWHYKRDEWLRNSHFAAGRSLGSHIHSGRPTISTDGFTHIRMTIRTSATESGEASAGRRPAAADDRHVSAARSHSAPAASTVRRHGRRHWETYFRGNVVR